MTNFLPGAVKRKIKGNILLSLYLLYIYVRYYFSNKTLKVMK